ncbi:MAG TPA: VC0807 family protein [Amycolatopsis sp.]|uniref:VC0807 family protein n=1 Tax=Amycolatopsis sp. TaxID=37632 RepID=UPI002B493FC3|nr:VC0807 family protein [Amycolatopsis sp.]HKS49705.1 VC0807 family protein [Amycolatopsis sp.]
MTITATATRTTAPNALRRHLMPLVVDVAVPIGSYYLLSKSFGVSETAALGWSGVVPMVRTVWGLVKERRLNGLALLMFVVNVAGLLLSLVTGDPRLMLAKDSGVSSIIGISILVSVFLGRPLMTTAMRPFVTKGDPVRIAAWDRLSATSAKFRRAERMFSIVWGTALLAECVARIVGAYTLPVDTMVWLGTVVLVAAIVVGSIVGGALAVGPIKDMMAAELERR